MSSGESIQRAGTAGGACRDYAEAIWIFSTEQQSRKNLCKVGPPFLRARNRSCEDRFTGVRCFAHRESGSRVAVRALRTRNRTDSRGAEPCSPERMHVRLPVAPFPGAVSEGGAGIRFARRSECFASADLSVAGISWAAVSICSLVRFGGRGLRRPGSYQSITLDSGFSSFGFFLFHSRMAWIVMTA